MECIKKQNIQSSTLPFFTSPISGAKKHWPRQNNSEVSAPGWDTKLSSSSPIGHEMENRVFMESSKKALVLPVKTRFLRKTPMWTMALDSNGRFAKWTCQMVPWEARSRKKTWGPGHQTTNRKCHEMTKYPRTSDEHLCIWSEMSRGLHLEGFRTPTK